MRMDGFTMPALPRVPSLGHVPTYRIPRRVTAIPQGPRIFQLTRKNVIHLGGPGAAPPGFVRGSTSLSEWFFYYVSKRKLDPYDDPRQPPFNGGTLWLYQSSELGAFTRQKGSAVIDFFYKTQYPFLAVRIQTYRFHLAATSMKQAYDLKQMKALMGYFDVVDVFEQDLIGDPTGQEAMRVLIETLGLQREQNPIAAGKVYLVRNALVTQR